MLKMNRIRFFTYTFLWLTLLQHIALPLNSNRFQVKESGLALYFVIDDQKLRHQVMVPADFPLPDSLPLSSAHAGLDIALHCFGRNKISQNLCGGNPGNEIMFISQEIVPHQTGKQLIFTCRDSLHQLSVASHYHFYTDIPVIRRYTVIKNNGKAPIRIDYSSSALINNFLLDNDRSTLDKLVIHWASNTWTTEAQWRANSPVELGWFATPERITGSVAFCNRGSMSTNVYLSMGMLENRRYGVTWFWQIEHSGPWYVELAESERGNNNPYLYLGGPDNLNHHAMKELGPGEAFQTVPVAIGVVSGDFDAAVAALTRYRRIACKKHHAVDFQLPVVFNDYMNCLNGNPTTEKLVPLIDAASRAGCEYFVIDAGWYAELDEAWWGSIGAWEPSHSRFPGGLNKVYQQIEKKGMIPGIWLEIELAGIFSPLKTRPDSWFFQQHGQRVIEGSRYFLDFRNPEVIDYVTGVVDRLRQDYHIGYIKKDYNCSAPYGTDWQVESPGQGMLAHVRAHMAWIDSLHQKYPDLIIENCSGGGMRADYSMLSQHQLQSSSDQTDYRKYPAILVGMMAAVLPEQLAAWTYPRANANIHETTFNMVTALAGRIHQSGRIDQLSEESFKMVENAIMIYKSELRDKIPEFIPFFPVGMPDINDLVRPVILGMKHPQATYYWIWRLTGDKKVIIENNSPGKPKIIFPRDEFVKTYLEQDKLVVELEHEYSAVIIKTNHK